MVGTMGFFALNDTVVKAVGQQLELWQIVVIRGVMASCFLALLARMNGVRLFPAPGRDRQIVLLRSAMEAAATYFFLTALMTVPLATLTAVLQMLPLTVTFAAALFLGETVGWRRRVAIGLGCAGMLLIVRPGPEGLSLDAVYALLAVTVLTVRDIITRFASPAVSSLSLALNAALGVTLFGIGLGAVTGWQGRAPEGGEVALLALAAGFILLAYLLSAMTMRVGEVSAIAPFRYAGLLWALILGWMVFGDWPDQLTMMGAAIVVAAGLFSLHRAAQRAENT